MTETNRFPVVVSFRIDASTQARLGQVADAKGLSPNIFCRAVVLREIGVALDVPQVRRAVANRDQLRELVGELGRIGNNLNQTTRWLNGGGSISAVAADVAAIRAAYENALANVAAVLGVGRDP